MNPIMIPYDDKQLSVISDKNEAWFTQDDIANLFDVDQSGIARHIKNIFKDEELEKKSVYAKIAITASDGKRYKVAHYNLDMVIAVGYRVNSKKATKFRKWSTTVLTTYLQQGVAVNPKLAEAHPEQVQDNFYTQFSPSMKRHLNRHGHTEAYQKERLDNIEARKGLSREIVRTVDGKPNFGAIMGLFHYSLTGKTKRQLLANYEHATKSTSAVDALGSMVVNQMNILMQALQMNLEQYPEDYIPDDVHIAQIERLIERYSKPLRQQLHLLSEDLNTPVERLGENSRKNRLL
jgi:hypothetical protein